MSDPKSNHPLRILVGNVGERGLCLSSQLLELGHSVTILDMSQYLYGKNIESWQNPFGYFLNERTSETEKYFLENSGASKVQHRGFSAWLQDGPIDFKQSFSDEVLMHRLNVRPVKSFSEDKGETQLEESLLEGLLEGLYSTSVEFDDLNFVPDEKPFSLFDEYYTRSVTTQSLDKDRDFCIRQGGVFKEGHVSRVERQEDKSLAVSWERDGHVEQGAFDRVFWTLSSYETDQVSPSLVKDLYEGASLQPDWVWRIVQFKVDESKYYFKSLPNQFTVIFDEQDQLSHSNLLVVKKHTYLNEIAVWFRWPKNESGNEEYFQSEVNLILKKLKQKMVHMDLSLKRLNEFKGLEPFYNYNRAELNAFKKGLKTKPDIMLGGPEFWAGWDMPSMLKSQRESLKSFLA